LDMSAEEALWELEQFQVAELAIRGETVEVIRKLTTPNGKVQILVHVMSLSGEHGFPGVKESI